MNDYGHLAVQMAMKHGVNCWNAKAPSAKPISSEAKDGRVLSLRALERSETRPRAKAVIGPRAPRPLKRGEDIVRHPSESLGGRIKSLPITGALRFYDRSEGSQNSCLKMQLTGHFSMSYDDGGIYIRGVKMPRDPRFDHTLRNRKWLETHYLEMQESVSKIAKDLNTHKSTVIYHLKSKNISVRSAAEGRRLQCGDPKRLIKTLYNKNWLYNQYVEKQLSARHIATMVNCATSKPVIAALKQYGIPIRSSADQRRNKPTKNHYKRDDVVSKGALYAWSKEVCPPGPCVICGALGHVHHKDYNVANLSPSNLERLCKRHHQQQHDIEAHVAFENLTQKGLLTRQEGYLIQHSRGRDWMENLLMLAEKHRIPLLAIRKEARKRLLQRKSEGAGCVLCGDWGPWLFKDGNRRNQAEDNRVAFCRMHKETFLEVMRSFAMNYAEKSQKTPSGRNIMQISKSLGISYLKLFEKAQAKLKDQFV